MREAGSAGWAERVGSQNLLVGRAIQGMAARGSYGLCKGLVSDAVKEGGVRGDGRSAHLLSIFFVGDAVIFHGLYGVTFFGKSIEHIEVKDYEEHKRQSSGVFFSFASFEAVASTVNLMACTADFVLR